MRLSLPAEDGVYFSEGLTFHIHTRVPAAPGMITFIALTGALSYKEGHDAVFTGK
jgi:hypothetical protein